MNIEIDDEEAIAAVCAHYGYRLRVPQPDWLPEKGQTMLQRPLIDNPESQKDFAERCLTAHVSSIVNKKREQVAQAAAVATVQRVDFYAAKKQAVKEG
jgi:hypothetical protein